jgi:hypothetical protein
MSFSEIYMVLCTVHVLVGIRMPSDIDFNVLQRSHCFLRKFETCTCKDGIYTTTFCLHQDKVFIIRQCILKYKL